MPLQATSGAASYDAFGGGVASVPTFVEDVFSTTLYDGTTAVQTITNNIDLSTKGGLVWIKARNFAYSNALFDTVRGDNILQSNLTDGQYAGPYITYNSTGFSLEPTAQINYGTNRNYCSWTFRKQPKFFDVVTYTGNGTSGRAISHNLQSTAGTIFIKRTDTTSNWLVMTNQLSYALWLNSTNADISTNTDNGYLTDTGTSSTFSVYSGSSNIPLLMLLVALM